MNSFGQRNSIALNKQKRRVNLQSDLSHLVNEAHKQEVPQEQRETFLQRRNNTSNDVFRESNASISKQKRNISKTKIRYLLS